MSTRVAQLALPSEYRELRQHIFPSQASLDWYLRKNRSGLVQHGALLILTGRWFVDPEKFDVFVVETGSSAAKAHASVRMA